MRNHQVMRKSHNVIEQYMIHDSIRQDNKTCDLHIVEMKEDSETMTM